ncbi:DUF433 domain-containing protein [Halovivax sp.]|uniref:DUF433 domain-containing protein n=1 Tax=Halovivax sp. TaxID=1935978 RepID=UPI0025C3F5C3|nr:DUF433 domain-containing protein [Halovivax sp.]
MPTTTDDEILRGEPRIEGTRVGVRHVAGRVIGGGRSPAYVADRLECSLAAVYEALAYYYDHPEEMRELERANGEVEDVETLLEDAEPDVAASTA